MAGNNEAFPAWSFRPPPYSTIFACIAMACLLLIAMDVWRTVTARATEMATAEIQTANLAPPLAQHAHDTLSAADVLLVSLRSSVEADGLAVPQREWLRGLIASRIASVPAIRDLVVFDAGVMRILHAAPKQLQVSPSPPRSGEKGRLT